MKNKHFNSALEPATYANFSQATHGLPGSNYNTTNRKMQQTTNQGSKLFDQPPMVESKEAYDK